MTPLHYAARYGNAHIVEVLLKLGAKVNVPQKYGWRPVHEAAMYGRDECLELLLKCGSHVNAKTGRTVKGTTPLHYAVKYGHLETAKVLYA
jgi:ankyrin repeat protein